MRVLTIKQPYAELIVSGKKSIELRSWKTKLRGEFLIHASKAPDIEAMKRFGYTELPLWQIVGIAKLEGCIDYNGEEEFLADKDKHLSEGKFVEHGFVISNPRRIVPIDIHGKLNFWHYNGKVEIIKDE